GRQWLALTLLMTAIVVACSPERATPGPSSSTGSQSSPARPPQTLDMTIQVEPGAIASRALVERGVALHTTKRAFNADLVLLDDRGLPQPYLAEALPKLNTDTWRVSPSGEMETIY